MGDDSVKNNGVMEFRTAIVDETGCVMFWVDTLQGDDQVEAILAAHPEWSCVAIEQNDY